MIWKLTSSVSSSDEEDIAVFSFLESQLIGAIEK